MEILPFIQPAVNWQGYIKQYREIFGDSPTKKHDAERIPLNDPIALPLALDNNGSDRAYSLSLFAVSVVCTVKEYSSILPYIQCYVLSMDIPKDKVFFIAYNTLLQWKYAIRDGRKIHPFFFDTLTRLFNREVKQRLIQEIP